MDFATPEFPDFIEIAPGQIMHRYQLAHAVHPSYRANTDHVCHPKPESKYRFANFLKRKESNSDTKQ